MVVGLHASASLVLLPAIAPTLILFNRLGSRDLIPQLLVLHSGQLTMIADKGHTVSFLSLAQPVGWKRVSDIQKLIGKRLYREPLGTM